MLSFISSSAALALILAFQAQGHVIVTPALGGGTTRNDVQRPSQNAPCGKNVDIAALMATATPVPVQNGVATLTATNFNLALDGSRALAVQIDPTGTGSSFQPATMATNGEKFPLDKTSETVAVQIPASMQATTGKMLLSFKNDFGFGNCVVVMNSAAAGAATTATGTGAQAPAAPATGTATGTGTVAAGAAGAATQQGATPDVPDVPDVPATGAAGNLKANSKQQKGRTVQKFKVREALFRKARRDSFN